MRCVLVVAGFFIASWTFAQTPVKTEHVAPDPPQHTMGDMSYRDMVSTMQMDDTSRVGKITFDEFEWRKANPSVAAWDLEAWYGGDYDKILLRTEGERSSDRTEGAHADLFWDRIFARWWSAQFGARGDFGDGPTRSWAAVGVAGLAPYRFEIEATFYVGDAWRTAARFKVDYDLLLTQRLVLRPEIKMNFYGKDDPERGIGSGLSDLETAVRLRYELRREFAPYIGVMWKQKFSGTADHARAAGLDIGGFQALAGLRVWF